MQVQKQEILSWDHLTHFQEQDWIGPSSPLVSPRLALYGLLLYGELMRRQRAGRPTPCSPTRYLPLAIQQIHIVSEQAHTLISEFSPVCWNDQGWALHHRCWSEEEETIRQLLASGFTLLATSCRTFLPCVN